MPEETQQFPGDFEPVCHSLDEPHSSFSNRDCLEFRGLRRSSSSPQPREDLSIKQSPRTSASIPLWRKVRNASAGVLTIGSPLRLKEVFRITGTPVASPKVSMR